MAAKRVGIVLNEGAQMVATNTSLQAAEKGICKAQSDPNSALAIRRNVADGQSMPEALD